MASSTPASQTGATAVRRPVPHVLFVTPELAPWMKSGGLGDVAHALPVALRKRGVDVRLLLPAYPAIKSAFPHAALVAELGSLGGALADCRLLQADGEDGVPLLLVDCPAYFERPGSAYLDAHGSDWRDNHLRFGLLSRVAALFAAHDTRLPWRPQVIHCNDWPAALAPALMHYGGARAASILTVHNLAFQGNFPPAALRELPLPARAFDVEGVEFYGQVSFLKGGLYFADRITTVSPRYAEEIQSAEYGCGLDGLLRRRGERLVGILNGIDTGCWDPRSDPLIARQYGPDDPQGKAANKRALQRRMRLAEDSAMPLLGCAARLTHQKGIDLLPPIATALADIPVQLAVLGAGDADLERALQDLAARYPGRFAVQVGYDESLAHLIEAGADVFLMPSRFEPCGLNQMYSLRYGTPPVVRATGGLVDTVVDASGDHLHDGTANGFVFHEPVPEALLAAVLRAVALWKDPARWRALQRRGMNQDFGWERAADRYAALYREAIGEMRTRPGPAG